MATAAPAFATSGANLSGTGTSGTAASPQGDKNITVKLTIANSGTAPTCDLRVSITSPNAVSTTQTGNPANWTVVTPVSGNTVVYDANNQLLAGQTIGVAPNQITFVVERGNNASGTVTVYIDPGCGGTPKTLTFTI